MQPSLQLGEAQFRQACSKVVASVAVVGVHDRGGAPRGITISSFVPASLKPPLILFCIRHESTLFDAFPAGTCFTINVLKSHQEDISRYFGGSREIRTTSTWTRTPQNAPAIAGALVTFECIVAGTHKAGAHDIVVARVTGVSMEEGEPLTYFERRYCCSVPISALSAGESRRTSS